MPNPITADVTLGPADKALLAAEQEIADLRRKEAALQAAGDHEELSNKAFALDAYIAKLAPDSLIGAAVKLRRLADPEVGLEAGDNDDDVGSVRQILAIVERSIAPGSTCNVGALRERVSPIIAEFDVPLPEGDAALDEAVRGLHEMNKFRAALFPEFEITMEIEEAEICRHFEPLDARFHRVLIETEPQTLAGAATMRRYALDDGNALLASPGDDLVANVLALIERIAKEGGAA
jgi:hypothetical protein